MHFGQVEGTDIQVLDPRFKRMFAGWARVERLWTGARWSEGPVWFPAGRCLIWSDIPNNRMLRWIEESGAVSVFRAPSNNSNGNTIDNQGRLVTCEHLTRRVTRTEVDGSVAVVADRWQDYQLLDAGDGLKMEKWGPYTLVRPDPQIIWPRSGGQKTWEGWDGFYHRSETGGGKWRRYLAAGLAMAADLRPRSIPRGAIYINVSHFGLEQPGLLARLDRLLRAVKRARQRANGTDAVKRQIGATLFHFIHDGIVA